MGPYLRETVWRRSVCVSFETLAAIKAGAMQVYLNGEPAEAPDSATLAGFLDHLGLPRKGIAVERNREIVPKSAYEDTCLSVGDRLEIVQFVGGG